MVFLPVPVEPRHISFRKVVAHDGGVLLARALISRDGDEPVDLNRCCGRSHRRIRHAIHLHQVHLAVALSRPAAAISRLRGERLDLGVGVGCRSRAVGFDVMSSVNDN